MDSSTQIAETPEGAVAVQAPGLRQLFFGFLGLGMMAFGGALPLAHRMLVEDKRWLDETEFTELLGLCQFLPGGNMINLSVAVGMRFRGVKGAFVSIMGLVAMPSVVLIMLGMLYERFQNDAQVAHVFAGLAAAAAGLLVSMAIKIALPLRKKYLMALVALICFIAIALLRWPLLWVMLVMTPLSIWVTARSKK
ncbi:chromate transporter [Herminiimonas glaciei]|uniref:Chromate transporter n=1 Tax=Herminiimonas glaciei TaxID=523788 RepID=A0ABW2IAN2_9BURK